MARQLQKSVKEILDKHNWSYNLEKIPKVGYVLHVEWYSPLGENMCDDIELPDYFTIEDIYDAFYRKYDEYDAEEHAELWIEHRGQNGTPSSIRDLLDDADEIGKIYDEIVDELRTLYKEGIR